MPKEKGFALIPVLIFLVFLAIAGFFAYQFLYPRLFPVNLPATPEKNVTKQLESSASGEVNVNLKTQYSNPFSATQSANPFEQSDTYQNPFENLQ